MDLSNLKPAKGATKSRKRIGRGQGSGYGGHTATKGNKGQKARSGGKIPVWFEGGQMPLQRRIPKYGFKNPFRTEYHAVNVSKLADLVASGAVEASAEITPDVLRSKGLIGKGELVKVLGGGDIDVALNIKAHAYSKTAKEKIEKAGGTADVL
ncbi:MAG: 50S ribosomal protein L15 [Bacteroidetes bacterium]|jgi:large subunit ribosomal protein L15|nr:50S ribosomal protein L15 [Bacteroidota bacterium]